MDNFKETLQQIHCEIGDDFEEAREEFHRWNDCLFDLAKVNKRFAVFYAFCVGYSMGKRGVKHE